MVVDIPEFPNKRKAYPGLYCIASLPPEDEKKQEFRIKIGMSSNMRRRLQNYHTCYPYGFYIYGLLFATGKTRKEVLELEKQFFQKIISINPNYYLRTKEISGAKEYFKLPIAELKKILKDFAEETKTRAVVDFKDNYVENDDPESQLVLTDSEYKKIVNTIERKVADRERNETLKNNDMNQSSYKDRLRKRVQSVKQKLHEYQQAQIDFDISNLKRK